MANNKWTDRVRDYKLSPQENSWQEIEAKLPQNKKKRFLFGWWTFLLLGIISAFVIWQTNLLYEKENPLEKTSNQTIVNNEEDHDSKNNKSGDDSNSNESNNFSNIDANIKTGQTQASTNNPIITTKNGTLSTNTASKNKTSKNRNPKKTVNSDDKILASNTNQKNQLNLNAENQIKPEQNSDEIVNPSNRDSVSQKLNANNQSLTSNNDSQNSNDLDQGADVNKQDDLASNDSLTGSPQKPSPSLKDKKSDGSNVMIVPFGNFVFGGSNLNYLEEFKQYGAKQSSQMSYGIMLAFKFKNDKARAYLGYDISNYVFNSNNVYIDSLNQNSITRNINYISNAKVINSVEGGSPENLQTRLSYHSYTIGMDYMFKKQAKWQIRPYASFSLSNLKKQNIYITSENNLELGELNSLYTAILRMNFGVGFEYQLLRKAKIFVMPNFEYYPTIFNQYSNSLYGYGLRVGINFRF